jgi:uncharacterized protein (DUF4415 family)
MKAGTKTRQMKKRSKTDWKRVDALRDEDIDFSDIPKLGPKFFANAIIWPGPKKQITSRIDPDLLSFFRKHGRGYQSTINAVLRKYMKRENDTLLIALDVVRSPRRPAARRFLHRGRQLALQKS